MTYPGIQSKYRFWLARRLQLQVFDNQVRQCVCLQTAKEISSTCKCQACRKADTKYPPFDMQKFQLAVPGGEHKGYTGLCLGILIATVRGKALRDVQLHGIIG